MDTGWRISLQGDAPLEIDLRFPVPLDRMAETSPSYTANRAVNAVGVVCDAAPGIRSQIIELVDVFEGRILNVGHDRLTISLEGPPNKLDDFEELIRPYGIAELQRTGRVALPKLDNAAARRLRSA